MNQCWRACLGALILLSPTWSLRRTMAKRHWSLVTDCFRVHLLQGPQPGPRLVGLLWWAWVGVRNKSKQGCSWVCRGQGSFACSQDQGQQVYHLDLGVTLQDSRLWSWIPSGFCNLLPRSQSSHKASYFFLWMAAKILLLRGTMSGDFLFYHTAC